MTFKFLLVLPEYLLVMMSGQVDFPSLLYSHKYQFMSHGNITTIKGGYEQYACLHQEQSHRTTG